jgi:hydroxypyruvate isomerase
MRLIANISLMFTELSLCERIEAAAKAGFDGIEIQFPYAENMSEIQHTCAESGMNVELINLPAGNWDDGDVGLAALPNRRREFLEGMELCAHWASELGAKKVNVLAGKPGKEDVDDAFNTLVENLKHTAEHFAKIDVQVQLEAINSIDMPGFFVDDLQTGLDVVRKVNHSNLRLQFDFYHMVRMGYSLVDAIEKAGSLIGHVQFADVPGRHEPGTGNVDFGPAFEALKIAGYEGAIAAEYHPYGNTIDDLGWMADFRKLMD